MELGAELLEGLHIYRFQGTGLKGYVFCRKKATENRIGLTEYALKLTMKSGDSLLDTKVYLKMDSLNLLTWEKQVLSFTTMWSCWQNTLWKSANSR